MGPNQTATVGPSQVSKSNEKAAATRHVVNLNNGETMDDYFGLCSACHNTDGYLNVGSANWFICKTLKKGTERQPYLTLLWIASRWRRVRLCAVQSNYVSGS